MTVIFTSGIVYAFVGSRPEEEGLQQVGAGATAPFPAGVITLFFATGQALGPVLGGYLADSTQSFTVTFLAAGGISLVGMILSFFLRKPELSS